MILVDYKACGHALEIATGKRDEREEIERSAAGQPCPRCRAELDKPLPRPIAEASKPDRRAATSAANGRRGGRPTLVPDKRIYSLAVSADLYAWLKLHTPQQVRAALDQWRARTK